MSMLNKINPMAPQVMRYADGGDVEQLLAPAGMMEMEEAVPVETATGGDPLLPLAEILGPDKANEMYEAISVYPVVEEIANMATITRDGMVEGAGTGTSDEVPARLSDGEYILTKEAVDFIGKDRLDRILEEVEALGASY